MSDAIDNSAQARFVKNIMKKDHPELSEEEIERMWIERSRRGNDPSRDPDDDVCLACGS
jgi:hypothetical protein